MATPVVVVLVLGALGTVVGLAVFVWLVVRRVTTAVRAATAALEAARPVVARIEDTATVTQRELDRVRDGLDELAAARNRRRTARRGPQEG